MEQLIKYLIDCFDRGMEVNKDQSGPQIQETIKRIEGLVQAIVSS